MSGLRPDDGPLNAEALAAAAAGFLVGVLEDEAALQLVVHEVHFGADQEHGGGGVDQDLDALVLHDFLELLDLVRVLDGIAETGAATSLDADAQADSGLLGLG